MFPLPPFPLFANLREPTTSAPRGDTLGSRIDRDNSLLMPLRFVRQAWPSTRRSRLYYAHKGSRSAKTSELVLVYQRWKRSFLPCGKRSTKNQGEQLQLVVVEAKGACVRRKLGAPFSRRRCGSHPEYAHSVYKNALNKFSFIRLRQRRTSPSRQSCEIVAGVFVPTRADSKDFLRGSDCENKCSQWQSPLCRVSI